jgi:hypothetical protein
MADFLKTISDKFLDFFNIGRAISIFIPGMLVSFALLMLLSLVIFPPRNVATTSAPNDQKIAAKPVTTNTAASSASVKTVQHQATTVTAGIANAALRKPQKANPPTPPAAAKQPASQDSLGDQIGKDFGRVARHYWVVVFLSLVLGIILYEVGNAIIGLNQVGEDSQLFRFKEKTDQNEPPLVLNDKDPSAKVGLIYFAPYLKDEFISGKENYYNFLITEYYRFLEFSAIMPLSVLLTSAIIAVYYKTFCVFLGACSQNGMMLLFLLAIALLVFMFYKVVFVKIFTGYRKASAELIKGITDMRNKGLIK